MSKHPVSVPIALIDPNPRQPRSREDPEHIRNLAISILQHGLQQYPKGRKVGKRVQLAYGHSRLAAHKLLVEEGHVDYYTMPVILQEMSDLEMLELAVVENHDRKDLNPVEEARSMAVFYNEHGYSQRQIADLYKVSQALVTTRLRLLQLDPEILRLIEQGRLPADRRATEAWLSIPDQAARVALAQRKAARHPPNNGSRRIYRCMVGVEGIVRSCASLARMLEHQGEQQSPSDDPPSVNMAAERVGYKPSGRLRPPMHVIQEAALLACNRCTIRPTAIAEPAWTLIAAMAGEVCDECTARAARIESVCRECPAVDLLSRIMGVGIGPVKGKNGKGEK